MMNKLLNKVAFLLCLLSVQGIVFAYEESTHSILSKYAAEQSVLKTDTSLLSDLGLGPYQTLELKSSDGDDQTVRTLIEFGSKFEDNGGSPFQFINPFVTKRFFRHFFDPQSGSGLSFVESFPPSPDWALERSQIGEVLDDPLQDYSYNDARNYFYTAFSCQTLQCRQDNFSATFQSIGHVIHHLQDMGQPQHSRLDTHPFEPNSFYEKYTVTKNAKLATIIDNNRYLPPPPGSNFFTQPRAYWQAGDGKGMAEFSSTKFVSIGTMFREDKNAASGYTRNPGFPLPSGADVTLITRNVTLTGVSGNKFQGNVDFLETTIVDPVNGRSVSDVKLATLSILDVHLNNNELAFDGEPPNTLTVNSQVFESRYPILLPRIAAFSTDFINYFFRGRLDMVENPSGSGWLIKNRSNEAMTGAFNLFYDDAQNTRRLVAGWDLTIPPNGQSSPVEFAVPAGTASQYILAFNGALGQESGAVAGKVLNINPIKPIPCGQPVNAGGGTNGYRKIHGLGTEAGQVELDFEAYSIPDAIRVTPDNDSNNNLVNSNGQVSGFNVYKFNYDPNSLGTTKVEIKVTGNSDSGTAWVFTLGCPGQNLGNSDRASKRVNVTFRFGLSVSGADLGDNCNFDVYVDGKREGSVGGSGGSVSAKLTEGTMHRVSYANVSCQGIRTGYRATFTDSGGSVSEISSPKFDSNANISINVR